MKVEDGQIFVSNGHFWRVNRLIDLSANLKSFKIPMQCFNVSDLFPTVETTTQFAEHVKKVNDADLDYPIILDDEGFVMDGRHRVIKAIIEKRKYITAVRFDETPTPDGDKD